MCLLEIFGIKKAILDKKINTCGEGGANLQISFFLTFIDYLTWKTTIYLKIYSSGPIKNKMILLFTCLHFLKK